MSELTRAQIRVLLRISRDQAAWVPVSQDPESRGVVLIEPDELESLCTLALRALAPAPADGFVVVPREPTQDMLHAAWACKNAGPTTVYTAMIEAAPAEGARE